MEDIKDKILVVWATLMTLITLFTIVYAVTISEVAQDLTTTVSFKDQDIQDLNYHINKITTDYNNLKLEKQELEYNFNHCVQELPHGD